MLSKKERSKIRSFFYVKEKINEVVSVATLTSFIMLNQKPEVIIEEEVISSETTSSDIEVIVPEIIDDTQVSSKEITFDISEDTSSKEPDIKLKGDPNTTEPPVVSKEQVKPPAENKPKEAAPSTPQTSKPKNGATRVENGENQVYIEGFGWIKDEGGGAIGGTSGEHSELSGEQVGDM